MRAVGLGLGASIALGLLLFGLFAQRDPATLLASPSGAAGAQPALTTFEAANPTLADTVAATKPSALPAAVQAFFHVDDQYVLFLRYRDSTQVDELYAAWRALDACRDIGTALREGKSAEALRRSTEPDGPAREDAAAQAALERMRSTHIARCQRFVELNEPGKVRQDILQRAAALGSLPAQLYLSRPPHARREPEKFAQWQAQQAQLVARALRSADPLAVWALADGPSRFVPVLDYAKLQAARQQRETQLAELFPGLYAAAPASSQPLEAVVEKIGAQEALRGVLVEHATRLGYDLGPDSMGHFLHCQRRQYDNCLPKPAEVSETGFLRAAQQSGLSQAQAQQWWQADQAQRAAGQMLQAELRALLAKALADGQFQDLGIAQTIN